MKLKEFTHANTDQAAMINVHKVFGFYYSDAHKCMLLLSDAGGVFPVKDSKEDIETKLEEK